eukprot:TRINITY_DN392_c0_g1_i2.p1 TRINITY_DN392_c0_g1~~TRINITY_DN392_c0_g1_i2.p1  ORF type:complete len:416 (+),score=65.13 TRINITY_DN392_c0_g1_i2:185-1432(+)
MTNSRYSSLNDVGVPEDKGSFAWIIFLFMGVAALMPWNSFIMSFDYFDSVYGTKFPFPFVLSMVYGYASVIFLFLSIKIMPRFSFGSRILTAFSIDLIVLVLVPFLPVLIINTQISMWVTLIGGFICGSASAVLFGSVVGLASIFPEGYTTAFMSGNGVAGIAAFILRVVTKVSMPNTEKGLQHSGTLYFVLAAFLILVCLLLYLVLMKLPITIYYMQRYYSTQNTERESLLKDSENIRRKPNVSTWKLALKIKREALTVFFVFFVTLSLFPGVTSLVPTSTPSLGDAWFQIIFSGFFMVFDFLGRTSPRFAILFGPKKLWIPVILRSVFFPLLVLLVRPRIFDKDVYAYIIMAVLALTNGYCGTLGMMYGPTNADPHEKETAGIIMSFSLNFGIFCATHFALLVDYLIQGSLEL